MREKKVSPNASGKASGKVSVSIDLISRRKFLTRITTAISSLALLPHKIARAGMGFMNMGMMWKAPGGRMWTMGVNDAAYGQLGLGDTIARSTPVQVAGFSDWVQVVSGDSPFTIGLRANGTIWSWGYNSNFQLGTGDNVVRSSPTQIGTLGAWSSVAVGSRHAFAIKKDGTLWSWGYGMTGCLGLGDAGTSNRSSPTQVGSLTNWKCASGGDFFSAGVRTDGTLWTWGANGSGQLGLCWGLNAGWVVPHQFGTGGFSQVRATLDSSFVLGTDGSLWSWGDNTVGKLGLGDTTDRSSPTQVGGTTDWLAVECRYNGTIALRTNHTLWAWGYNGHGQLGLGDTTDRSSPIQVSGSTDWANVYANSGYFGGGTGNCFAAKTDGSLWTWGYNANGQLGLGDTINRSTPVQIGSLTNWKNAVIGTGQLFTAAIKTDGTLWTWGINASGNGTPLGLGDTVNRSSPTQVGSGTAWLTLAVSAGATIAIQTDGSLWSWGYGFHGQVGLGDATARSSPVRVGSLTSWKSVTGGCAHFIAGQTDGSLWGWGYAGIYNSRLGALGTGVWSDYSSPVQIGSSYAWKSVSTGVYHTVALSTDGGLWSWGDGSSGALGFGGTSTTVSSPTQVGTLTCWSQVVCRSAGMFGIQTDGSLWSWGDYNYGCVGNAPVLSSPLGDVYSPVRIGALNDWSSISCGRWYNAGGACPGDAILGLKTGGSLWAWGAGHGGALGTGVTTNTSSPTQVGSLTSWKFVAMGALGAAFGIQTDGTLWAWGYNPTGGLGFGDTISRSTPVQVGSATNWAYASSGGSSARAGSSFGVLLSKN